MHFKCFENPNDEHLDPAENLPGSWLVYGVATSKKAINTSITVYNALGIAVFLPPIPGAFPLK